MDVVIQLRKLNNKEIIEERKYGFAYQSDKDLNWIIPTLKNFWVNDL